MNSIHFLTANLDGVFAGVGAMGGPAEFISFVIKGIPLGCIYALVGIGLTLTYKTSGTFNLAFGAQAFLSAAVRW